MSVTANDIRAAATALEGQVIRTPMLTAPLLSRQFGCDLYVKLECQQYTCLLYTSPSPRDQRGSRMPSSA